ncbi:unnamed protein product [Moneuplotes crassus]|uniref:Cyclic nucleotide-binding domain-containing protein n=1 Tax=Euplotes crassus TaxID=5936 RepID=A0AAD2CWI2_EUPCR|nr:unnamed protein product [Moneuplotes crassus]
MEDQTSMATKESSLNSRIKLNSYSINTRNLDHTSTKDSGWTSKWTGMSQKQDKSLCQDYSFLNKRRQVKRKGRFYRNIKARKINFPQSSFGKLYSSKSAVKPRRRCKVSHNALFCFSPIEKEITSDPRRMNRSPDLKNTQLINTKTPIEKNSQLSKCPKHSGRATRFSTKILYDWSKTSPLIEQSKTMLDQCKGMLSNLEERYLSNQNLRDSRSKKVISPLQDYKAKRSKLVARRSSYIESNYRYRFIPKALQADKDYKSFCEDVYKEELQKQNRNPFQICQLRDSQRTKRDYSVLKKWLRKLGFFDRYPELIMDRVCECLTAKEYSKDEVVINKGDESTFMIILFTGKIGIYLYPLRELRKIGVEDNCIACIGDPSVLGDRGLLNKEPRTATCLAQQDVKALYMSRHNYVNIVESFHKTQLKMNLDYSKSLEIMKDMDIERLTPLTHNYNNSVYSKGNVIVDFNATPMQLFILKEGRLKVEKNLTIKQTNLWPSGVQKWTMHVNKKQVIKQIESIEKNQVFGLYELLAKEPIHCRISVESEKAHIISINSSDLKQAFNKDALYSMLEYKSCIKFPKDSEVISEVIREVKEQKLQSKILASYKNHRRISHSQHRFSQL